jgi:predicted tellurium resistance membrane protein TerC
MTALPAAAGPPADAAPANTREESASRVKKARDDSEDRVERVRAWAGLAAVVAGDAAIAIAAIVGIIHFAGSGSSTQALPQVVAILSGAFTAIGTMTTAYFGIKAMSNTAKSLKSP